MILILLLGLTLGAVGFTLVARAAGMSRSRATETVGRIDSYGFANSLAEDDARGSERGPINDVASFIGGLVAGRFGGLAGEKLRLELMAAGLYKTAPRKFIGYRVLCGFSLPAVWAGVAPFSGALVVLGIPLAAFVGWSCPLWIVRSRAERRLAKIDYDLPELIDLLVVTVEAGLGFNASLQIASERLGGPLGEELRLALQEQSFGLSTNDALRNMLERAETPAMRSFVRSILQGETLGVSIGMILRNLATDMRKRRRAAAEERAQKAPIKILFPLIFLIFPAMFVVLLAPAIFSFIEAFSGG